MDSNDFEPLSRACSNRRRSPRSYSYRRKERYSLRVPKCPYNDIPRSLESIDDWSLYRGSREDVPRGARRVQSFRCTSKGSVVKLGDFFLGNASPDNYVSLPINNNGNNCSLTTSSQYHHTTIPSYSQYKSSSQLHAQGLLANQSHSRDMLQQTPCICDIRGKCYHVYIVGYKNVGKHTIMNACMGSGNSLKATILIDYEQFNITFQVITSFEDDPQDTHQMDNRNKVLLVIYSITDRKSFEKAGQLLTLCMIRYCSIDHNLPLCLIGNKSDLVRARVVSTEEGKYLADKFDAHFIEISSEIGENVESIMVWVVEKIRDFNGRTIAATKAKAKIVSRAKNFIRRFCEKLLFRTKSRENFNTI